MSNTPDFDYPAILDTVNNCLVEGRTESHSFLVWFLQNYYRLDETDSLDTVCDGPNDKGIDGIYIDENLETVDVFQAKLVMNAGRTLGDTQLKEFVGTLAQFGTQGEIDRIAETTSNVELASLLRKENVSQKIEQGYAVKGVFVTNIEIDQNGIDYLQGRDDLTVVTKSDLIRDYIHIGPTPPVSKEVTFDIFGFNYAEYKIGDVNVLMVPLKGLELVQLGGLKSQELFALNVRGHLGRTKVNKDIGRSINDTSEHSEFLLYHNGLTILCEKIKNVADKITVSGYSVVNGCQSLMSLYDHRKKITDELRIMVRLIELPPGHDLADKITHHSNNQNSISARDLQSNSTTQRRLQNEFNECYSDRVFYRIKRGEPEQAPIVIDNDEAGRFLLAFDRKQPWACHQTYRILDELHSHIFARQEVNAARILAIETVRRAVSNAMNEVEDRPLSSYKLTQYLVLFLVREALDLDSIGKEFCQDPGSFLAQPSGNNRIYNCCYQVVSDLVVDLNAEFRERKEAKNPIDYKREFKSQSAVRELSRAIITQYQKSVLRNRSYSFSELWQSSS